MHNVEVLKSVRDHYQTSLDEAVLRLDSATRACATFPDSDASPENVLAHKKKAQLERDVAVLQEQLATTKADLSSEATKARAELDSMMADAPAGDG